MHTFTIFFPVGTHRLTCQSTTSLYAYPLFFMKSTHIHCFSFFISSTKSIYTYLFHIHVHGITDTYKPDFSPTHAHVDVPEYEKVFAYSRAIVDIHKHDYCPIGITG